MLGVVCHLACHLAPHQEEPDVLDDENEVEEMLGAHGPT